MNWRRELWLVLGLCALWGGLSYAHLLWGGRPLARQAQHALYGLLGGRAGKLPASRPDPMRETLAGENQRLHALLALRSRMPGTATAAAVTRREPDTWWSELTLEFSPPKGGLPQGTAMVLTPQGLIGTVEPEAIRSLRSGQGIYCQATVRLLSSAETQLSVVVGDSRAPFLLEGKGGAEFTLRPVTSEAEKGVQTGDVVLTSGLGQLYSAGLQVALVGKNPRRADFSSLNASPAEVLLWWR